MNHIQNYASSLSDEFKYYANHNQNSNQLTVRAGSLSMIYENGTIRRIQTKNSEVLRMIYPSVRGKGWLTYYPAITEEKIEINPDSFKIYYDALYHTGEINFTAHFSIEGFADNSVVFGMEGEAKSDFEKNRIGFCILHPAEFAGERCVIGHTSGAEEDLSFPLLISPRQPFTDIRKMKWEKHGNNFTLDFSGDIFETEDQRNWTDASFKTYCTPLGIPYPVKLKSGEKIIQKVVLKVDGDIENEYKADENFIIKVFPDISNPLPLIGIGKSSRKEKLSEAEALILCKLRFDHYRIDLYLFNEDWKTIAENASREAVEIDSSLEIALFVDDGYPGQIREFIDWIESSDLRVVLVNIFHKDQRATPENLINTIGAEIRRALPAVKIASGTNANFTQVNRARPGSPFIDYLSYSIHPQEHASDNMTLVENLQAQSTTVESCMHFSNGKGIWVSPVNIQRRFNANTENYEHPVYDGSFPPQVDSRLLSLFGACWIAGSLKYLSEAGADGITFLETVGERGIMQGDQPSRWPSEFPSLPGMIFPVYYVFHFIAGCRSFRIIKTVSSKPLSVDSLMLSDGDNIKMIIVNFTPEERNISLSNLKENINFRVRQLNPETYNNAVSHTDWSENTPHGIFNSNEKLLLDPFSISFLEGSVNL